MSKKSITGAELGEKLLQAARETVHVVPGVPGLEECRRQSRSLCDDPKEAEILAELERVADTDGWVGED